jgi:DNA polymerase
LRPVYDIAHAGPRNRFTIRTKTGHLIVHNSGYAGWVGAWKAFGADEYFTDDEIKQHVLAWRAASPRIVELWGGQERSWRAEYYGLEGAAVCAVLHPGQAFYANGIGWQMGGGVLYARLLSGRLLAYHAPRLGPGRRGYDLTYMTNNTNPKYGGLGWVRMQTYGGRLTENIVQATSFDILAHAQVQLAKQGARTVLHVHDENIIEVPRGTADLPGYEATLGDLPAWAAGWPVIAAGGWVGHRYRKG